MEGPGVRVVDNETQAQTTRDTKDGRKFTYRINIIQQPERARACGSGAKSSADRRPVDPPPIVELKIFVEGEEGVEPGAHDRTFQLNANFFLFAALEPARNIAHGRVQQDSKNPPVLTGTPVAGMVYLDRPTPAGYFIFPDLSVRHEGKYRIVFSLFEQIKDPRDEDLQPNAKTAMFKDGWVSQRIEVRSKPFTVYSAKKFPGLAESTSLSRVVAEQGCRVRIRRDVRMRRRQDKPTKDWDGYEDETAEARGRMSATPETSAYHGHAYMESVARPRSSSRGSHVSLAPSLSRRPSLQDVNQGLPQPSYATAPHTPQNAYSQSSPYVPTPTAHYAQSSYAQHYSSMQPPATAYQPSHYHQYQPSAPPAPASQQSYYSYGPPPPVPANASQSQAALPPPNYDSQRMSVDYSQVGADYRRRSSQYPQSDYSQASAYHTSYPSHQVHHNSTGSWDSYQRPPPAEPIQPPTRTSGAHTPHSTRTFNDKLPPLNTTFSMSNVRPIEPSSPASSVPQSSAYYSSIPQQTPMESSNKRNYGSVFNDRHLSQPLRQGARPSVYNGHGGLQGLYTPADDEPTPDQTEMENPLTSMTYRRANGAVVNRNLPPHD